MRGGLAGTIFTASQSKWVHNLITFSANIHHAAIDALHQSPAPDLLRLQRLKKRKLQLRDRIAFIEDQITPDIIA